jgi:hypothetical protein
MAAARRGKEDLSRLIAEVGVWLQGGDGSSLDGGATTGGGGAGDAAFVEKLRTILPRLLDGFLDPVRGESVPCQRAPLSLTARGQSTSPPARR